jgi:hypothetical protein
MLSVVMLSVIMMSVVMVNVVAPVGHSTQSPKRENIKRNF